MKSSVIRSTHTHRVQESDLASGVSGTSGVSKLTPEMCKAIKRQEITTGMGYWKVGHNGITTHVHDKRPTYSRVTQINLDFPGAFLPSVNSQQVQQQQKPKRKEATGLVLSRSRTTLMPSILQPKVRVDRVVQTKKTAPELTCLQLADTLFASKSSAFAGFFNFAIPRSNYLEYFGSDPESNETHNARVQKDHRYRSVNSAMKYRTLQPDDDKAIEDKDRQLYSPTSPVFPTRWNELFCENKKDLKPQKSILKNGANKQNDEIETFVLTDSGHRDTVSPSSNPCSPPTIRYQNSQLKLESINPVIQGNNNPRYVNGAEIVVRLDERSHDMAARKRSVRFNAEQEVREYKPCEPVSFC